MKKLIILLLLLLLLPIVSAQTSYSINSAEKIYSTALEPAAYKLINEFSNLECDENTTIELSINLPAWYNDLKQEDINAFTITDENIFKQIDCSYSNRIISCTEFSDGNNLTDLNWFSLELGLIVDSSEGNPIRSEQWDTVIKFIESEVEEKLTAFFEVSAAAIEFETRFGIVSGDAEIEVKEIKGIPYYVKFVFQHPSDVIPERSDSLREDGWQTFVDSTKYANAPVLVKAFACDHKTNCGDFIALILDFENHELIPETQKPTDSTEEGTENEIENEIEDGITALNKPPKVVKIFPLDLNIAAGEEVEFSAEVFDESIDTLEFFWDFGNGITSSLPSPVCTFVLQEGEERKWFQVSLKVSDGTKNDEKTFVVLVSRQSTEAKDRQEILVSTYYRPSDFNAELFALLVLALIVLVLLLGIAYYKFADSYFFNLDDLLKPKKRQQVLGKELTGKINRVLSSAGKGLSKKMMEKIDSLTLNEKLLEGLNEAEKKEVKMLLTLLKPGKKNYHRHEIVNAIIKKGFSRKVAEKTAGILYKF